MKKYIILTFSVLISFFIYSAKKSSLLDVVFCDVGQGDATLLQIGQIQILVDAGPNIRVLECLENNIPFWDRKIEYLILTHMDSDHIGGATMVIDSYKIDFLFVNPSTKKTSDFNLLEQAVSRKKTTEMRVINTFVGQTVRVVSGLEFSVIGPDINFTQVEGQNMLHSEDVLSDINYIETQEKLAKISENNLSIALNIVFNNINIILPGDLEKEGELAIIGGGLLNTSTVLKAGHHGSKSSSNVDFIEVLQPEITIVSSGKNNAYNHPNPQVVEMFTRLGVKIFQTKTSGELNFATDGNQFWEIKR